MVKTSQKVKLKLFGQMYARLVVFTLQLEIVKAVVIVDGYKNKKSFTQGGYQQTSQYVFLKIKLVMKAVVTDSSLTAL